MASSSGPLISIVTPTYNQAGTIAETIESVLGQTYSHLEYLVFDAASKDGTCDILRRYEGDSRFRWISEPDRGQSHAISKGLFQCRGEIFNWINSDDYLDRDALRQVAEAFQANSELHLVSGFTDEFRDPFAVFNRTELQLRETAEESITVGVYCQPSTFWRTEIMRKLGGPQEDYHYMMDWDLWIKYLLRHRQDKIQKLDALLAFYRHHAQAKTTANSAKFYADAQRIFDRLHAQLQAPKAFMGEDFIPGAENATPLQIGPHFDRELYLGKYCDRMVRTLRKKNPAEARRWLHRGFSYRPKWTWWRLKMALRLR